MHRGHAARQVVVQVEQGRGALLVLRQMKNGLSVLEKDVGVVLGAVEVEEAERQFVLSGADLFGQAMRSCQAQAARLLGEEDGYAGNEKSARQLLDDGIEQGLEVGLGAEAAAEFDQRSAIVVAMAVEGAVDPSLNAALERIENRRR